MENRFRAWDREQGRLFAVESFSDKYVVNADTGKQHPAVFCDVEPYTECRDKLGYRIFYGDLIRVEGYPTIYSVGFRLGAFTVENKTGWLYLHDALQHGVLVIGNIQEGLKS